MEQQRFEPSMEGSAEGQYLTLTAKLRELAEEHGYHHNFGFDGENWTHNGAILVKAEEKRCEVFLDEDDAMLFLCCVLSACGRKGIAIIKP